MNILYIGTRKAQRIQAVSEAAAKTTDPRMKDFWEHTKQMIIRNR